MPISHMTNRQKWEEAGPPDLPATSWAALGPLACRGARTGHGLKRWADASLRFFSWRRATRVPGRALPRARAGLEPAPAPRRVGADRRAAGGSGAVAVREPATGA
ncbi:hypothetical protein GCM10009864_37670 [Streptomyces lunalinharesii]|uniref:Transposase n=1 Tax=Streptomyces lunalinharesii TaxID=333384 RepID=A0ABN3S0N6_9ACTN